MELYIEESIVLYLLRRAGGHHALSKWKIIG